jgi:tetratricopeptide (TPR) repeat protein
MKAILIILTFSMVPLAGTTPAQAAPPPGLSEELDRAIEEFDQAQEVRSSNPDRARQLLNSAAQRLESLLAAGLDNGYLEYNLGNTYLQLSDVGRAILHYRRAERLIPRDPLLAENLGVARARTLLSIPPARNSAVFRSLFFWHYQTSPSGRYVVALVSYTLFWILLALRALFPRPGLLLSAVFAALVCLAAGGSLAVQRWQDQTAPDAVVIANDVAVYKGPGSTYQKQFEQPLQSGVEVSLREVRGDWRRIELSDGSAGWVPRNAIELVPRPTETTSEVSLLPS